MANRVTTLTVRIPYEVLAKLLSQYMVELNGSDLPDDLTVLEVSTGSGDQAKGQCWAYVSSEHFARIDFSLLEVKPKWDDYIKVEVRASE